MQFLYVFFSCIYNVYVATSPEAISTETLPFFPWHIFALGDESVPSTECVCVCVCVCERERERVIQNCEYLFTSTLKSQESLGQCECVYTCVPVCAHACWK